ncbi:MAG: hypothetical protein IKS96_00425 [Fibrobacter sp.]|nr:hypothetical protein [Fibrobacter sp.]
MATLTLPLKRKWFDMIKSGVKLEEYRECSEYWIARFQKLCSYFEYFHAAPHNNVMRSCSGLNVDRLVFTLGYPKADDTERRLEFKNPRIRIDEGKPEWGAEPGKIYFVITWED